MEALHEPSETDSAYFRREPFSGIWRYSEFFLLGGIFSLGVLILVIHLATWGVALWKETNGLVETNCVVRNSFLRARNDSNGNLFYRPEIQIEYVVRGETFSILAYDRSVLTEDQGFVYTKAEVLDILSNYPVDKKTRCWFDEEDPKKVVLQRKTLLWGWIFLIIPVTLLLYAGITFIFLVRSRSRSLERRALIQRRNVLYPTLPSERDINESPGIRLTFRLPIVFFPFFQLTIALTLAVLWNLIAWSIFVYVFSSRQSWGDLILAILFGLVFCGSGFAFVPWIVKRVRTAFRFGSTILEISDHPIWPGRKLRLTLIQDGWLEAEFYRVCVVCEEIARFRQGTDTITNRKEVFRQELWSRESLSVERGQTLDEDFFLQLPIGAMHSMEAENNVIRWKILIEMTRGGDVYRRECPIIVFPLCCPE